MTLSASRRFVVVLCLFAVSYLLWTNLLSSYAPEVYERKSASFAAPSTDQSDEEAARLTPGETMTDMKDPGADAVLPQLGDKTVSAMSSSSTAMQAASTITHLWF